MPATLGCSIAARVLVSTFSAITLAVALLTLTVPSAHAHDGATPSPSTLSEAPGSS